MQRNLQMVVNRSNVFVIGVVVILVTLFTVVSAVRVIDMENISKGVSIIAGVPVTGAAQEITGVLVNPKGTLGVHVPPVVDPPVPSNLNAGKIRSSLDLDQNQIGKFIETSADFDDINGASIEEIRLSDAIAADAGHITDIDAAPIGSYIGDGIAEIAAARTIDNAPIAEGIS